MSEELRFFLRTALYTGLITVVYWFVAYEWAGTVLLAALFGAALSFVLITTFIVPATRSGRLTAPGLLGFTEGDGDGDGDGDRETALEIAEEGFPAASIWPVALALGGLFIGLGAIFGLWLLVPGIGVTLAAGAGWILQLKP